MSKTNHGAEAQGGGGSHQGDSRQPGAGANSGAGNSKKTGMKNQPAGAGEKNWQKEEDPRPGQQKKEDVRPGQSEKEEDAA